MKKITLILLILTSSLTFTWSQGAQPPFTPDEVRTRSMAQRQKMAEQSLINGVEFSSIGPTVFSGRVDDLEVSPDDPSHFYVAYASGGLWKTENNGQSFEPLFDKTKARWK